MRKLIVFSILMAMMSVGIASIQPSPKEIICSQCAAQNFTADQRGTEQSPLFVEIKSSPKDHQAEPAGKAEKLNEKFDTDRWLVYLTGVLAVATIGLVFVTGFLWRSTNAMLEEAKSAGETAKKSADAAKESVDLAKTEFLTTKRAYVFVDTIHAEIIPQGENKVLRTHITWRNSGATPTKNMKNYINWRFFDGDIPENYTFPDLDKAGNEIDDQVEHISLFIAPYGITSTLPINIDTSSLDKVKDGNGKIFIYGWAEYLDIIEPDKIRRTEFCSELVIEFSRITDEKKTEAGISFSLHKRHNGMDEECEKQPGSKPN